MILTEALGSTVCVGYRGRAAPSIRDDSYTLSVTTTDGGVQAFFAVLQDATTVIGGRVNHYRYGNYIRGADLTASCQAISSRTSVAFDNRLL